MQTLRSRDNPTVKNLCRLMKSKKHRREQGVFLVEGVKLCGEAVRSGVLVNQIFYTREAVEKYPEAMKDLLCQREKCTEISVEVAQKIADTEAPQGVFCLCSLLDNGKTLAKINSNGKYLALSSLQDPGNIGTILRTAEAFLVDGVILSSDCPDIYSPKVLRATMGSVFRLPIAVEEDLPSLIHRMQRARVKVYGAALTNDSISIGEVDFSKGAMTLIGNEGNGLSKEILDLCDQCIRIPMKGRAESLNAAVAAGVVLWEMTK